MYLLGDLALHLQALFIALCQSDMAFDQWRARHNLLSFKVMRLVLDPTLLLEVALGFFYLSGNDQLLLLMSFLRRITHIPITCIVVPIQLVYPRPLSLLNNARGHICLGCGHSLGGLGGESTRVNYIFYRVARRGAAFRLLRQEHELELFYLGVKLVEHLFLHGKH